MQIARDITDLLPDVLAFAPSCPEPLALDEVRHAARKLCQRTKVWRERDQFQVSTPESEGVCTLNDVDIVEIKNASLDAIPLIPKTVGWLDEYQPDWETYSDSGPARYITQLTMDTVTVFPKVTGLLKVRLVLKPSRTARTLPDFLVEQFGREIGRGAAGEILLKPNTEYTNPKLGAALVAQFDSSLGSLAIRVAKGQQRAPLRSKARYL